MKGAFIVNLLAALTNFCIATGLWGKVPAWWSVWSLSAAAASLMVAFFIWRRF